MATEQSVTAIVLRRFDSGDSDRRVILLTREAGKVDAFAKGARKSASRLAAATEPLCVGTYQISAGRARAFITQFVPNRAFPGLRHDFDRLIAAIAVAEVSAALLAHGQAGEEPFVLLMTALAYIENAPSPVAATLWSLARILNFEGVAPVLLTNVISGENLDENPAYVSPTAGGYIGYTEAEHYRDAFPVRAEALIALGRIGDLATPPNNVKYGEECARALAPFLEHQAHTPLPALQQWVQSLREGVG